VGVVLKIFTPSHSPVDVLTVVVPSIVNTDNVRFFCVIRVFLEVDFLNIAQEVNDIDIIANINIIVNSFFMNFLTLFSFIK
jgi:hypothetical protein